MDRAVRYGQVGMALLVTTVFVLCFDLATSAAGLLPETYVLLLAVYVTAGTLMGWLRISDAVARLRAEPFLAATAAGYLAADLLSALYSPDYSIVWQKYKVAGGLVVVATAILLVADEQKRLDALMFSFGGAAVAAALCSWAGCIAPDVLPTYYRLRISPRADYNMFAAALLTGLVCAGCALSLGRMRMRPEASGICFFLLCTPLLPTIYLSGSRRAYLTLIPVAVVLSFCWLSAAGPYKGGNKGLRRRGALLVALAVICVLGAVGGHALLDGSAEDGTSPGGEPQAGLSGETPAVWRYGEQGMSGLMTKRMAIYSLALEGLSEYRSWELLLGRGLGSNILMYDMPDSRIDVLYPDYDMRAGNLSAHNMLLADMLDGGAVKLSALLLLLAAVARGVCVLLWLDARRGIPYVMAIGLAVMNGLVSGRFGLLYDRFFVLMGAMLLMEMGMVAGDEKGAHDKQPAQA